MEMDVRIKQEAFWWKTVTVKKYKLKMKKRSLKKRYRRIFFLNSWANVESLLPISMQTSLFQKWWNTPGCEGRQRSSHFFLCLFIFFFSGPYPKREMAIFNAVLVPFPSVYERVLNFFRQWPKYIYWLLISLREGWKMRKVRCHSLVFGDILAKPKVDLNLALNLCNNRNGCQDECLNWC